MTAEIIVIGDEIILGLQVDTNSAYISQRLAENGIAVKRITKVGDDIDRVVSALALAGVSSELVVTCGGLGPTHDDMTRDAVARFLDSELRLNESALGEIQENYTKAGRTMSETNRVQAMIPDGSDYLSNRVGTAPGLKFTKGQATFFCFQGVPKEMEWMTKTYLLPFVQTLHNETVVQYRILRTTGIPESTLYDKIKDVVSKFRKDIDIAFLPLLTRGVDIRLTTTGRTRQVSDTLLSDAFQHFADRIQQVFPNAVYGYDQETLEQVVARLFFHTKKTIATAESCTGGMLAHRLTNISGSSDYFMQGKVAYSNESKIKDLGVDEKLIQEFGAVSEEVAKAMALGVRESAHTDIGISTTGIAGPTGATPGKPIGLCYIGFSTADGTRASKIQLLPFAIDRITFKERIAQVALDEIRRFLLSLK